MDVDAREPGSGHSDSDIERRNSDRLIRVFGRFVGVGYAVYALLLIPDIMVSMRVVHGWWTPVTVVVVFGSGLVFGLSTFHRDIRVIQVAGTVAALSFLVMALLWWVAWDGVTFERIGGFLGGFPGLAALAAAVSWRRPIPVFAHMTACVVTVQLSNRAVRQPFPQSNIIAEILFGIMFCTVFVAASLTALRTARILDATITSTQADAARDAAARAREVERERFDALIHDDVMSSLLSVARQGRTPSLARQARSALADLDALHSSTTVESFAVNDAVARLRSAATTVDDALTVTVDNAVAEASLHHYPAEVVRAMAAALAEALRNSVLHARATARSVTVRLEPAALRVSVQDDGVGFHRRAVPPHRLGVAVSIEGRMRQLDGGSVRIDSAPSHGTTVILQWRDPAPNNGTGRSST